MALPLSWLSRVCRSIADFLSEGLDASGNSIRVMIGNPADAVPGQADTEHRVNLFFYRFSPCDMYADAGPGDTWWIKLHCLITAFGVPEEQVSSGENDLRLLGEVIRLFHETPILDPMEVQEQQVRMRAVFQPLNPDDLNHIWSTQNDVSFRPSVSYEMVLAPVVPSEPRVESPRVGAIGAQVRAGMTSFSSSFTDQVSGPPVPRSKIDTTRENWKPVICFVYENLCFRTLSFELGSDVLADFQPQVWIAGDPGAPVVLKWEVWNHADGWREVAGEVASTADAPVLDPALAGSAATQAADLPLEEQAGQALLYAERTYTPSMGTEPVTVKSNPLLISVYEGD